MKRLAIYPGSFNPFTVGHQNILEKTEKLFDEVIVAVGINPDKIDKNTLEIIKDYSQEEKDEVIERVKAVRVNALKNQLTSKKVEGYIGFLTEYVRKKMEEGYDEVVVIRGLRNGHDYDYEYNQTRHMWDQMPGLNIIMISCDPIYSHVSSSAYRALEKVKKGAGHHLLAIDNSAEDDNKVEFEDGTLI